MADVEFQLYTDPACLACVSALDGIHERLAAVLDQTNQLNANEDDLRKQQHRTTLNRCLEMASPLYDGLDQSDCSYFSEHRFYFEFEALEKYYWITSLVDRGYCWSAIYFPARKICVLLYPLAVELKTLERFHAIEAACSKPACGPPALIAGFPHFMHTLWNEIPAMDHAAKAGVLDGLATRVPYQAFGPMGFVFPQLAPLASVLQHDQLIAANSANRLLVCLGSRTITQSSQQRLYGVAMAMASLKMTAEMKAFRAAHEQIFWLSIKPPRRTLDRQADVLATLIKGLQKHYPLAGFILNGTSLPWDTAFNQNYSGWFTNGIVDDERYVQDVVASITMALGAWLAKKITVVSGLNVLDEIAWGGVADFYICHAGTMQNKIGWSHDIPGFIHSHTSMLEYVKGHAPVENISARYFPSQGLVEDCEAEDYLSYGNERRDQDYRILDASRFLSEVLAAIERSGAAKSSRVGRAVV